MFRRLAIALSFLLATTLAAQQVKDEITVTAKTDDATGVADSASEGVVPKEWISANAEQRAGSVLEAVPGVIVSQHSGEGKANQYYLRGIDLDHGTDFAISVAGVPLNLPTHAHGQGYADANFLIPELIGEVRFTKGPYSASHGDFAAAGAADIDYVSTLDRGFLMLDGGKFGYERALIADSSTLGRGHLLYAFEAARNNGPWTHPDRYHRLNGVLRYSDDDFSITAMAYDGRWNSTDQVADRAIGERLISRYGALDPSDGGRTHRESLSGDWHHASSSGAVVTARAFVVSYGLDLFSNFTYFLDDPVHGDQFEQLDRRIVSGGELTREWITRGGSTKAGLQFRNDSIGRVALFHTQQRARLDTISDDALDLTMLSAFVERSVRVNDWLRITAGGRVDRSLVTPKLSIAFGPFRHSEIYANYGSGFHSNDARSSDDALTRARGSEIGWRYASSTFRSTLSLWKLDFDSELLFAGDSGTTEATAASRRRGVEWAASWKPSARFSFDGELALARARFVDGSRVPEAPERVAAASMTFLPRDGFEASLRLREFGPRALTDDDTVRSHASRTISARVAVDLNRDLRVDVEMFNLTNAKASDIDYFYVSRLQGEPASGVADVHSHPLEPRSLRIGITRCF